MSEKIKNFHLPNTGNAAINVIVVAIIILSAIAVVLYAIEFVLCLTSLILVKMLMCVIFGMLYISIIKFAVDVFIFGKDGTVFAMLSSFSTSVLMTTITVTGLENSLFIVALLITIFVPFMQNDLTFIKRCFIVIVVVFILCLVWTYLKYGTREPIISGNNTFEILYAFHDVIRAILVWTIISALYIMRFVWKKKQYEDLIEEKGFAYVAEIERKKYEEKMLADTIEKTKKQFEKNAKTREKILGKTDKKDKKD